MGRKIWTGRDRAAQARAAEAEARLILGAPGGNCGGTAAAYAGPFLLARPRR